MNWLLKVKLMIILQSLKTTFLDTRNKLSTTADEPDLICLGCPHASLEEIKEVAKYCQGKIN